MISRRTFSKSLAVVSSAALITGLPLNEVTCKSPVYRYKKATRVVLAGRPDKNKDYIEFLLGNPQAYEIVAVVYNANPKDNTSIEKLNLPPHAHFTSMDDFFESRPKADVVLFIGMKDITNHAKKSLNAMYDVWSDRPISLDDSECSEINNLATEKFSQANFAYVFNNDLHFMKHKIYSYPV